MFVCDSISSSSGFVFPLCRRLAVTAAACLMAVGVQAGASVTQAAGDVPPPRRGGWAATVLALLEHSEKRCGGLGDRLGTFWRRLEGSEEARRQQLDHYLLHRATGDLAAARQAIDLVERFLPGVGRDSHPEIEDVLGRRLAIDNRLCSLVAQPSPPLSRFERQLEKIDSDLAQNDVLLSSLLVLPSKQDLLNRLRPYTGTIELAAGVALQQLREEMAAQRPPPPPPPTQQELMETWHARYQMSVRPTKIALGRYLDGRRRSASGDIQQACRDLLAAVIPLLDREDVFRAPDPAVGAPLRSAYQSIQRFAGSCTAGRFKDADEGLRTMNRFLASATQTLAPYALHP